MSFEKSEVLSSYNYANTQSFLCLTIRCPSIVDPSHAGGRNFLYCGHEQGCCELNQTTHKSQFSLAIRNLKKKNINNMY